MRIKMFFMLLFGTFLFVSLIGGVSLAAEKQVLQIVNQTKVMLDLKEVTCDGKSLSLLTGRLKNGKKIAEYSTNVRAGSTVKISGWYEKYLGLSVGTYARKKMSLTVTLKKGDSNVSGPRSAKVDKCGFEDACWSIELK